MEGQVRIGGVGTSGNFRAGLAIGGMITAGIIGLFVGAVTDRHGGKTRIDDESLGLLLGNAEKVSY